MRTNNRKRDEAKQRSSLRAVQAEADPPKNKKAKPILWSEWWPFERATGDALRQLNRPQSKRDLTEEFEEAPL